MFSLTSMPSTTSVLSTYTSFAASAMLLRTVISEVQTMTTQLIPQQLQEKLFSKLGGLFGNNFSSQITLIIDEHNGLSINEIYQASDIDLSTIITPSVKHLKVSKAPRDKNLSITIDKGEKITDVFEGIRLIWEFVSIEKQKSYYESDYESSFPSTETSEQRSIHLSFHKKYKEIVLSTYLPYVVDRSKVIKEENKVLKLYSLGNSCQDVNLDHPSTFDTLAMDPKLKKELMDDLNRFLNRRVFYRRVGKAWKRGYLLYGPPGTGKSSLIAAMANYMKFDIYDLELSNLHSNADLRRLIASTANRSILVIEDIDCTIELQDRQYGGYNQTDNQLTLSGLLNFIDGLWTSCGDERIIVFTTNHKDRLDPALLRPGRMDMHIHMSYCTPSGFKILASNYLRIEGHCLFTEIEGLIKEVEVTPAEVAEELMKSEDPDIALAGLVAFLQQKKKQMKCSEESKSEVEKVNEQSKQSLRKKKAKESKLEVVKESKRKKARSGKSRR